MKEHEARVLLRWNALADARWVAQISCGFARRHALQIMSKVQRYCLVCGHSHKLAPDKWKRVFRVEAGAAELVSELYACGYAFRPDPSAGEPWLRVDVQLNFERELPALEPGSRTEVGLVCSLKYQVRR